MSVVDGVRATPSTDEVSRSVLAKVPSGARRQQAVRALRDVFEGREHREYADLKLRRGIFALHDAGVPQREIAKAAGISQPEVSRRLKRRELRPEGESPLEVILARRVGATDTSTMLERLSSMPMTSEHPDKRGAHDAAATATGTAKQLMSALRSGLISEDEYEAIRRAALLRSTG